MIGLNPTRARFEVVPKEKIPKDAGPAIGSHHGTIKPPLLPSGTQVEWRARDNRKGKINLAYTSLFSLTES